MKRLSSSIKPTKGFSHLLHILLNILLPLAVYILVRIDFVSLAIALVLLSKWRMFAVRPRYWLINILANGVDILVGVSIVLFMANTTTLWWQVFWAVGYGLWLVLLKPRSDVLSVSSQAMVAQLLGLSALYVKFGNVPLAVLVAGTWGISYVVARHFFASFDEIHTTLFAHVWAYFSASLAFILGHWLIFYGVVAQIMVILTVIGYTVAALYYLEATNRLTDDIKRYLIAIMGLILLIIITLSKWSVKIV